MKIKNRLNKKKQALMNYRDPVDPAAMTPIPWTQSPFVQNEKDQAF